MQGEGMEGEEREAAAWSHCETNKRLFSPVVRDRFDGSPPDGMTVWSWMLESCSASQTPTD